MSTRDSSGVDRRGFLKVSGVAAGAALGALSAGAQEQAAAGGVVRVAMLSSWHVHARGYARELASMPDVKLTAVWDEDPERGKSWAESLSLPFEADLQKILARDDVDAVAVDAPTSMHAEVMTAAAVAGKHIFTEKVMALTIEECQSIAEAVKKAGVKFCISFPYRTRPETLYAHKAVQDGLLGKLTFLRVRVAHNGVSGGWLPPHFEDPVTTGGGAMMDLGAHPMYLARWIGGRPKRIASMFSSVFDRPVEDNAVCSIEFESEAIGVTETSFVSTMSPFSLELSGTDGSLVVGGPDEKSVRIRSGHVNGEQWVTPESLPEALPSALRMWIDGILKDTPIPFGLEEGIQLTELMEYAYRAHREGKTIEIPERLPVA
jgi:predicted dehydrogenase